MRENSEARKRPAVAALGVILSGAHVLLVRRSNEPDAGKWGFPGGHIENGETGFEAARREVLEETNVHCEPISYLTNVDVIVKSDQGTVDQHFLLAAVLCKYSSGEPAPADDVSEARWVPFNDILNERLDFSAHVDTVLNLAIRSTQS